MRRRLRIVGRDYSAPLRPEQVTDFVGTATRSCSGGTVIIARFQRGVAVPTDRGTALENWPCRLVADRVILPHSFLDTGLWQICSAVMEPRIMLAHRVPDGIMG